MGLIRPGPGEAAMILRRVVTILLLGLLMACSADEPAAERRTGPEPTDSPTAAAEPLGPVARDEAIREVLRAREADPAEVIALAGAPMAWTTGQNSVLLEYGLARSWGWPSEPMVVAAQVVDREGEVLGQWIESLRGQPWHSYWPVGDDFVATPSPWGGRPVLVRDGTPSSLTGIRGARAAEPGDLRVGDGWLLDLDARSLTRETIPGCRPQTILTEPTGRTWCLDEAKRNVAWSDDRGATWSHHELSASYVEYCDGGTLGSDLAVRGDAVAIGLWGADFSTDRGATWQQVDLPIRMVGSRPAGRGSEANCTRVVPLTDGRLLMEYFGVAVADDPGNTSFAPLEMPPGTLWAGEDEGVLVAADHRRHGGRWVSFDGGDTWQRLTVRRLLEHLLPEPGAQAAAAWVVPEPPGAS